jgi:hypothetical protein
LGRLLGKRLRLLLGAGDALIELLGLTAEFGDFAVQPRKRPEKPRTENDDQCQRNRSDSHPTSASVRVRGRITTYF